MLELMYGLIASKLTKETNINSTITSMHRKHKHDILVILSLLGFGVSIYLGVAKILGLVVPCGLTNGCDAVLQSKYANLFGIPLAFWGVVYFAGVIVFSLLANHYQIWKKILTWFLGVGALAAAIFLGLQFFEIKSICQYCLITDILVILLFLLDLNIEHKKEI